MKKIKFAIIALFVLLSTTACSKLIPQPEETIYRYEKAINEYDMEAAIKCFEPSVQKIYAGGIEVGNSLLGIDMNTIIGAAGGLANIFGDELVDGGLPKMSITINSKEVIAEDKVLMNITCTFDSMEGLLGESYSEEDMNQDMDVCLVLIDGQWYISADSTMPEMY